MQPWRQEAACRDMNPNLFFPSEKANRQIKAAKAICRGCFCRTQCLEYALETDSEGIWGGTTYDERAIISDILSSSDVPSDKTLPELEPEIRKEPRICSSKPQRRQSDAIPLLVLNLPECPVSHNRSPVEKEAVLVAVGFSAPALILRFG